MALSECKFSLNQNANDTSLSLDLLRGSAAQMVCVGHAVNLFMGPGTTSIPNVGVLVFFLLSGFLIAHTLFEKSRANPNYGMLEFFIERFARIYSAYLPALIMIGLADTLSLRYDVFLDNSSSVTLAIFLKNIVMLENYPGRIGVPTFGSAGQLSSVAAEVHIYIFVGALFFLFLGRSRFASAIVATVFSSMPLGYFAFIPDSDRSLFVLWLMGFAAYFIARSTVYDRAGFFVATISIPVMLTVWIAHLSGFHEYDLGNFPVIALTFLAIVVATQFTDLLVSSTFAKVSIRFLASYAFSLFLLHYTIIKVIRSIWMEGWLPMLTGIMISNVLAFYFSKCTERQYRSIGARMKMMICKAPSQIKCQ